MKQILTLNDSEIENKGVVEFYDSVALHLGYVDIGNLQYDCRKINVALNIQDAIFAAYESSFHEPLSKDQAQEEIGMRWVISGPKTKESLANNEIEIQEGFILQ